jgi:hypothetical protein
MTHTIPYNVSCHCVGFVCVCIALTALDTMMRNIATAFSILPDFTPYITWLQALGGITSSFTSAIDSAYSCTSGSATAYPTCWTPTLRTATANGIYMHISMVGFIHSFNDIG